MISLGRILLVPVVVWLLVVGSAGARWAAGIVFLVGAVTDGVDGYLARRWDVKTKTGQWLDPLADKALVAAPIITLAVQGEFPIWAAVLILGREVAVALLRVLLGTRGRSMPASFPAKVKTVTQIAAITMYVLPLGTWADGLKFAVLMAAVVLTLFTGVQYAAFALAPPRSTREQATG
jgi:CDP-diacylglycerol---glycerol-3-phosphate 3-phosphatidyltransferase